MIQLTYWRTDAATLAAEAPDGWHPHALAAPQGWYMLFLFGTADAPSVAHFIHLH